MTAAAAAPQPERPTLSVLVAAWNAAGSIEKAVGSVLEERGVPLECIVVDDGSTDGTGAAVRRLAAADPRVVLLELGQNVGVSSARNRGLELVRGDWLTLLDADDRFVPGGLAELARAALGSDALVVVGQQVWFDGRRRWRTAFYENPDITLPGRKPLAEHPGLLNFVSPHAKLLHRSAWAGLTFSGRVLGDQAWVIRALLRAGEQLVVIGPTVYEWYRPKPGRGATSITIATRSEVSKGLEAIGVAEEALRDVGEEARRVLPPAAAERVLRAYLARLLAMDVGPHLGAALGRSDRDLPRLFDAVRELLPRLPEAHLRGTDALARAVLEPPLRRWVRMPRAAWPAYWRLFDAALAIDPGLARHGESPVARFGLALAASGHAPGRVAAAAALGSARLASGSVRLIRDRLKGRR